MYNMSEEKKNIEKVRTYGVLKIVVKKIDVW